jgi:hypothetical protein
MTKRQLIARLRAGDPGWVEYGQPVRLAQSLEFESVDDEFLGAYITAGERLTFALPAKRQKWPRWIPPYVPALLGMKAADCESTGGFAATFDGTRSKPGALFSVLGNDEEQGLPLIKVPRDIYPFQENSSGALFHISSSGDVFYPNADTKTFQRLDALETFTKKNLVQAVKGEPWFDAYPDVTGILD